MALVAGRVHAAARRGLADAAQPRGMQLYTWGKRHDGVLGFYSEVDVKSPTRVRHPAAENVIDVSIGRHHLALVTGEGAVFVCGTNRLAGLLHTGRLGIGEASAAPELTYVEALEGVPIRKVSCGPNHTMALSEEGEVYTWGLGALPHLGVNGLGHPGYLTVSRPQLVEALRSEKIVDIAIGAVHALVVTADGRVLSWGRGDFGLLGTGRARDRRLPGPISLARASGPFSRVFAARHHSAALATDGALVTFGRNLHGQLGRELGSTLSAFSSDPYPVAVLDNVTHAACGTSHMVACTANGHLYQWGFSSTASAQVPMNVSMAWAGLDKLHFKEVAAGRQFSLALDASGRVFAWGSGLHGATGLGDRARRLAPEELASFGPDTKIGPAARIFAGPRVSAALVAHSTQSN